MSDIVGHGRLNGPWNAAPTPPVYSLYTQTRIHTPDRSPTPPIAAPSTTDTKPILFLYFLYIQLPTFLFFRVDPLASRQYLRTIDSLNNRRAE